MTRADLAGDGQQDLLIVYSLLSRRRPYWFAGALPPEIRHDFVPERPYLKVVFPNGTSVSTQIRGPRGTWAAAFDFVHHVGKADGEAIFLTVTRGSSGGADVVYSLRGGRLISAGPSLEFGGDSAWRAGFACVAGHSPSLVQRTFDLIGPSIYGWWKQTNITYAWDGPKLVQTDKNTFEEHGQPSRSDSELGRGCGPAIRES